MFELHDAILAEFGGTPGFRDEGLVRSALEAPIRGSEGEDRYPTFFWKVAALGYLLTENHGFTDANKRTALSVMEFTLKWNGEFPRWSQETKTLIMKMIAAGYIDLEGVRFALLSACGHNVDQYHDLEKL